MAFAHVNSRGQQYFLHQRDVVLQGGRVQRVYFFGREANGGAIDAMPAGYIVVENSPTGLPLLKKMWGTESESPVRQEVEPSSGRYEDAFALKFTPDELQL